MPTTTVFGWPYPAGTDADNVPLHLQQALAAIETTLSGAWATWTASVTNCPGTSTARYRKIGRTVQYRLEHVLSGAPTGGVGFTLPAAPVTPPGGTSPSYGIVHGKDVSAGAYLTGQVIHNTGSTVRVMLAASATTPNLADMTATVPITWASGDFLSIWGEYEAAS